MFDLTNGPPRKQGQGCQKGCGIGCLVLLGFLVIAYIGDCAWKHKKATTKDPASLARLIVNQEKANATASWNADGIEITYSIDPWLLTEGTGKLIYLGHVKKLVPEFLDRFPKAQWVRVTCTAKFIDLRGNESEEKAYSTAFTRGNAAKVNWENVAHDNIPVVADEYWQHPSAK